MTVRKLLTLSTVLFDCFITRALDLHSDSSTGLIFLHNLKNLVVYLQRCTRICEHTLRQIRLVSKKGKQERETYTFPSDMTVFFFVSGSVLTTHSGVPILKVPSIISTPKIIAAIAKQIKISERTMKTRLSAMNLRPPRAKQAMVLSLHGQTALGAASAFFCSMTEALYAVNASNK
jgi:hypothetical protein